MPDEIMSGADVQEVAAPAGETTADTGAQGGEGQDITEPAAQENGHGGEGESDGGAAEENGGEAESDKPWKNETNAQYAAARRRAEREKEEEIARIRADYARREDELIASMGFAHPDTGAPLRTRAEYDAARSAINRQQTAELARRAGVDEETFARLVEMSPAVREANEVKRQAQAAEQAARAERIKQELREEVAEIGKIDPAIKSVEDLRKSESWPKVEEKVRRGYSLLDAYRLANMDAIGERRAAAARQQALNSAAQKQHMQKVEQQGTGSVSVPSSVKEMYRQLNPKATDAEIERHYAKYQKTQK